MLDIKYICENTTKVKEVAKNKNVKIDVEKILKLDEEKRSLMLRVEKLREERNKIANNLKASKGKDKKGVAKAKTIREMLKDLEPQLIETSEELLELMYHVPNVYSDDTPIGQNESHNKVIEQWGQKPKFNFKPKNHIELAEKLDLIDLSRGVKTSGFRGYYLKNQAVQLQFAVLLFALEKMIKNGFTPMIPPSLVQKMALIGSGHFPEAKDDIYQITNPGKLETGQKIEEPVYLAGTSEPSLLAYRAGEVIDEKELPLKYCGFSQCYRSEIGSYGKDTKGLYRVHEFMKIEQVVICKGDYQEAQKWHKKLLEISQSILKDLKLPHQIVLMCTGDMGLGKYKMYDIETWMPGRNSYGETHSDSNLTDWQTRRLNIRYKNSDGKKVYPFALNNTGIACPRILIAILENCQQADGSIEIPEVLQKYCGFKEIKTK